ncbi:MAG: hypothetical protein HFI63_10985 [Lachnospiraceae bacterium]|nr:hypothetical protein [Lachnospiraceae bacterium]
MGIFKKREEKPEKKWPTIRSIRFKRYSEGFTFYRVPRGDGRPGYQTVSVYTGDYYFLPKSAPSRIFLRVFYSLSVLAAAGLFLFCGTRAIPFNVARYTALLQLPVIFLFLYTLTVLFYYIIAPKRMTVYDYRTTSLRLQKSCLALIGFLLICTLAAVLYLCFTGFRETSSTLLCAAGFLFSAVFMDILYRVERKLPYEKERSQDRPPKGGIKC